MQYDHTRTVTYDSTVDANFESYGGDTLIFDGFGVPTTVSAAPLNTQFTAEKLLPAYRFEKFNRDTGTWSPLVPDAENSTFTQGE
jgi:hypothetical protein